MLWNAFPNICLTRCYSDCPEPLAYDLQLLIFQPRLAFYVSDIVRTRFRSLPSSTLSHASLWTLSLLDIYVAASTLIYAD